MLETWVRSLGWEDPLEKGMTTYSNILAGEFHGETEPVRLQTMGLQSARHGRATNITDIANTLQTLPNHITCEGNIFETR